MLNEIRKQLENFNNESTRKQQSIHLKQLLSKINFFVFHSQIYNYEIKLAIKDEKQQNQFKKEIQLDLVAEFVDKSTFKIPNKLGGGYYMGQFQNKLFHGHGILIYGSSDNDENGYYYQGRFVRGEKWGFGRIIYTDGNFYEGMWRKNKPWGQGIQIWLNKKVIICQKGGFKLGLFHGKN